MPAAPAHSSAPADPDTTVAAVRMLCCDHGGCSAAGRVRVVLPSGAELAFCGHHARALEPGLLAAGARLEEPATADA